MQSLPDHHLRGCPLRFSSTPAQTSSTCTDHTPQNHHAHGTCITQEQSPHGDAHCNNGHEEDTANFDCNICLDACYDPVVTMCGHLFCWPCLYHWISCHSVSKECPVCKTSVDDRVIPLYGRGKVAHPELLAERFPGMHVPCRPTPLVATSGVSFAADGTDGLRQGHRGENLHHSPSLNPGFRRGLQVMASTLPMSHLMGGRHGSIRFLLEGRRFGNEKEFVLHWGFIIFALLATLGFVLS